MEKLWMLTLFCIRLVYLQASENNDMPYGHPNRCYNASKIPNTVLRTFAELPGLGFDNLQNINMAAVFDTQYHMCKTTSDGKFVFPDSVAISTKQQNYLKPVTTLWDNISSTTSGSINMYPGIGESFGAISGKFSPEYKNIKTTQHSLNSSTLKMQIRFLQYEAELLQNAELHPEFRKSVEMIAGHIVANRTELAMYESQLLVRKYGTHVVTSVELGTALVKVVQLKGEIGKKSLEEKEKIKVAAEWSFLHSIAIGKELLKNASLAFGMTDSSQPASESEYKNLILSTEIYNLGKTILSSNISGVKADDEGLVALDRSGEPIYAFINKDTLPDVPYSTLRELKNAVKDAVDSYYEYNVINGCTDPSAANFSFAANLDDRTCNEISEDKKYSFGGIYQNCTSNGSSDLCEELSVNNILTKEQSCPEEFQETLLHSGSKTKLITKYIKTTCGFPWLSTCYNVVYTTYTANYSTYWCHSTNTNTSIPGLDFGGLFTPFHVNILTQASLCPSRFFAVQILNDVVICISENLNESQKHFLPFAGFYSCQKENPFVKNGNKKRCPDGFNKQIATIRDGCRVYYCIKTETIRLSRLPPIHRPPYVDFPVDSRTNRIGVATNGTIVDLNEYALNLGHSITSSGNTFFVVGLILLIDFLQCIFEFELQSVINKI